MNDVLGGSTDVLEQTTQPQQTRTTKVIENNTVVKNNSDTSTSTDASTSSKYQEFLNKFKEDKDEDLF